MLINTLRSLLSEHATRVLAQRGKTVAIPPFDVSVPPPKVLGDLATNVALTIAKAAGESPRTLAHDIMTGLKTHPWIANADIAGAGFINLWLRDAALIAELKTLVAGEKPAIEPSALKGKILLEFVSANPTGPLHVGHGRGAALGDSLARIFRYLGQDVTTEFYINDSGGQIRNLGLSVEARIKEINGESFAFPENGYKGHYVIDLAHEIVDNKVALTPVSPAQMVFSEHDASGYASQRILKRIQNTLADFGVSFDHWYPESALHAKGVVQELLKDLKARGLAYDQEGATWFPATRFGDEKDRVLQKANEAPTYFASDIAYHLDKFNRGYKTLVNIWGADHHGYAQRLKGALQALGQDAASLNVVFNQLISVKGNRMSKRAGDMVTLQEVVDDVGRDATRFFFALRSPGAHFEFDLDLAKKQANDNPVFYVQYVHARCCSIFREAAKRGFTADGDALKDGAFKEPISPAEKAVLFHLSEFDKTVQTAAHEFSSHPVTTYLLDLAGKYHSFYEHCHVLVEDPALRTFRLALVDAIRRRVATALDLIGVSAPHEL